MWYWLGGCHCDTSRTLNWWRYELFRSENLFCWKGCCCWCCWILYWFVFSTENEAIKKSMLVCVSNGLSYKFTLLLKFEAPWFRVPPNHHKNLSDIDAAACQFLFWWFFFRKMSVFMHKKRGFNWKSVVQKDFFEIYEKRLQMHCFRIASI